MLSRIATRTLRAYVQAALGGPACGGCPAAVPGLVVCVQTFGAVAYFHQIDVMEVLSFCTIPVACS